MSHYVIECHILVDLPGGILLLQPLKVHTDVYYTFLLCRIC